MRDDPQSILSSHRIQHEAVAMLEKRGLRGENLPWDGINCLWSFVRGDVIVVCVNFYNKENAESLLKECGEKPLVAIYMDHCTHVAGKLFSEAPNAELWDAKGLCIHPFKFSFLVDAGIVSPPLPSERDKFPKISLEDPLCRYLGAKLGNVVWSKCIWGALGCGTTYRIVVV